MKKRILCYGDSNTWGYDPISGGRYDEDARWPMRLQALLGDGWRVAEEGLNGRTITQDDPTEGGYKSGLAHLPPILQSHLPLDAVAVMLGTNDCKARFNLSAEVIGMGMGQLVKLIRQYAPEAEILLIAPAAIGDGVTETLMGPYFGQTAAETSRGIAREYLRLSKLMRTGFLDAGRVCRASDADCVHLTREGHAALAEAVANQIIMLF